MQGGLEEYKVKPPLSTKHVKRLQKSKLNHSDFDAQFYTSVINCSFYPMIWKVYQS